MPQEMFKVGDRVITRHPGHLRKGHDSRQGIVVGSCREADSVRVRWDGWQAASSTPVLVEHLALTDGGAR